MPDVDNYRELGRALGAIGRDVEAAFWSFARPRGFDQATVGQLAALVRLADAHGAARERDRADGLQRFKDWCHGYLDAHGVPHHPPGTHGAEGCRIGDRLDWLMGRLRAAEAGRDRLRAALSAVREMAEGDICRDTPGEATYRIEADARAALGEEV